MKNEANGIKKTPRRLFWKPLPLAQVVTKLKSFASTKFDQTVNIALFLGIDTKMATRRFAARSVFPRVSARPAGYRIL